VREVHDKIERRRVGPVRVFEHEQHRRRSCPIRQQRERLLEHRELGARGPRVDLRRRSERSQGLDEGLIRQLGPDEIDRVPQENLETRVAGACRELGCEPGLADAGLAYDQDGRTAARPGRAERAFQLPELA